jgi:TonB-dependent SusC/RagA subfamily outer membrane receptor
MRTIFSPRLYKQIFSRLVKCALAFFCLGFALTLHAQTNVQGRVTDESGKPVQSASVTVKGTTRGTTTNENGMFTISASPKDVLIISFVGLANKEIKVGNQSDMTVSLSPVNAQFEEVIVIGYGTTKHASVTGAISTVNNKTLNEIPVVSVQQALQGRVPGLQVVNNGSPGTEPIVRIRGISSITYASNPLYVVDGFPTGDLSTIDTRDIESVDVLKDASAAAIYGSRASSGVIMITTKKGKRDGRLHVSLDSYYGIQNITERLSLLNPQQFGQYAIAYRGSQVPRLLPPYVDQPIYQGATSTYGNNATDWQDE